MQIMFKDQTKVISAGKQGFCRWAQLAALALVMDAYLIIQLLSFILLSPSPIL